MQKTSNAPLVLFVFVLVLIGAVIGIGFSNVPTITLQVLLATVLPLLLIVGMLKSNAHEKVILSALTFGVLAVLAVFGSLTIIQALWR